MILKKKKFYTTIDSDIMSNHSEIREATKWTSSNGVSKLYKDLDINHLKNILAKFERGELEEKLDQLFDLKNELDFRNLKDE